MLISLSIPPTPLLYKSSPAPSPLTLEPLSCDIKVVASAESESEAIHWLAQPAQDWRLAIVDLFLRPGSGMKVLAACKNRQPQQKVVVLTNYATREIRKTCLNLGADAVFDKSSELDALIDYCNELVQNQ
jgi:two-component system OmpR family response regulator